MVGAIAALTAFGVSFDPRMLTENFCPNTHNIVVLLQFLAEDVRAGIIVLNDLARGCDGDG